MVEKQSNPDYIIVIYCLKSERMAGCDFPRPRPKSQIPTLTAHPRTEGFEAVLFQPKQVRAYAMFRLQGAKNGLNTMGRGQRRIRGAANTASGRGVPGLSDRVVLVE
jgi:hypothetical protein